MHVKTDGIPLILSQAEPADIPENRDRTAAVASYACSFQALGCADIVQQRRDDYTALRKTPGIGQGISAGLKGMPCKTAEISVMRMTPGPEKITVLKISDSGVNALAPR